MFCVVCADQVIADLAIGQSQRPDVAMTPETLMVWLSATKPITAICIALSFGSGGCSSWMIWWFNNTFQSLPEAGKMRSPSGTS